MEELDPECAALAWRAVQTDHAAHRFNESLGQRQTEACAFYPSLLGAQPVERLEQPLSQGWGDPRPSIRDADPKATFRNRVTCNGEPTSLTVVFDRVRHEVQEHLLQPLVIRPHVLRVERLPDALELDRACDGQRPRQVQDLLD